MPLTKEKIKHFQEKLEEEKKQLESELSRVGRKKPGSVGRLGSRPRRFECGNIGHG